MKFADPVTSLKETIPLMKKQGAGMVILLSHSGLSKDIEIAQNVKGIDLIVGGHTHDTLETPVRVGDTTIVQAGCDGAKVGKVVMEWDPESQKAVSARGQLIPVISGEIAPDEGVSSILQRYQDRINSRMNARIGEIGQDMVHPADGQESSLGNFITDTMREKTGAQVALLNSGCIRTDLLRGEVKFKDIYSVLPFDSKIVSLEMKGEDLLGVLEDSAGKEKDKKLQVSGLDVVYNSSRLQGQRLISAATEDGQPIDPQKTYTVATIDYLAKGGDQYRGFSRGTPIHSDTGALQMELAKKVVNTRSSLSSAKGRIKDLGA
jgi:2',3'-cyclic-nucleotide 2'-phosphodiesterase (5'-nucleotidase family)